METSNFETLCACALNRVFGFQPGISLSIIENLGSASAFFNLQEKDREMVAGPAYAGKLNDGLLEESRRELETLADKGCLFLPSSDARFPALLSDCPDCPAGIYVKSSSSPDTIFGNSHYISIVGTRNITSYGREYCIKTVGAIARGNGHSTIVSGLAIGVDITAHLAALDSGIPTIAVLPTGIDDVYPYRHREAAKRIAEAPGSALITDFPTKTTPLNHTFLRRNRIIAGISESTILIESREKGGGMITAGLASGYGRNVFALPGRVDDEFSKGCNLLIAGKTAEPLMEGAALAASLGLVRHGCESASDVSSRIREFYAEHGRRELLGAIAAAIRTHRGISVDELASKFGIAYSEASGLCRLMECDGHISIDLMQGCSLNAKNA